MIAPLLVCAAVAAGPLRTTEEATAAQAPPSRKHPAWHDPARFLTSRKSPIQLPLPSEEDAFFFVVFGDRTGGPADGVKVLAEAVDA